MNPTIINIIHLILDYFIFFKSILDSYKKLDSNESILDSYKLESNKLESIAFILISLSFIFHKFKFRKINM